MRRILLTLTGATLVAIGSVTAQVQQQRDTTDRQQDANEQSDMARQPRMQQQEQPSERYNSGEMVIIQHDQIPEALRQTLQDDEQYKGWENAIIYQNTRTGEYLVSPRPHRFDSQGQPIDTYDRQRSNQQGNQQSNQQGDQQRTPAQDQAMSRNPSPTDPNRQLDQANQQDRSDETGRNDEAGQQQTDPQQSNAYRTDRKDTEEISVEGMTLVERDAYPSPLQETLKDPKYEGWEMGKLYKDSENDGYVLVIDDKSIMTGAKRYYRFDKDGKEVTEENSRNQERDQD